MLNRDFLVDFLKNQNQNPILIGKYKTQIETSSAGTFYTLCYSGDGQRVGWGASDTIIAQIKEHRTSFILLTDATNDKMYVIPNGNYDVFLKSLKEKNGCYKIDVNKVKDKSRNINYEISFQNFHEYIGNC